MDGSILTPDSKRDCSNFNPLLKLSRAVVADALDIEKLDQSLLDDCKRFSQRQGVFVTIHKIVNSKKQLRGCIGFVQPVKELWRLVMDAALSAAFHDPRFPPITKEEFDGLVFEISVLSKPEVIKADNLNELYKSFSLGYGLIVDCVNGSGLLLPQVFVEYNSTAEQAFNMVCLKAGCSNGLSNDCLRYASFYRFKAVVCSEDR